VQTLTYLAQEAVLNAEDVQAAEGKRLSGK